MMVWLRFGIPDIPHSVYIRNSYGISSNVLYKRVVNICEWLTFPALATCSPL